MDLYEFIKTESDNMRDLNEQQQSPKATSEALTVFDDSISSQVDSQKVVELEQTILALKHQNSELTERLHKIESEKKSAEELLSTLRLKEDSLRSQINTLQMQLSQLQDELTQKVKIYENEKAQAQQQLSTLKAQEKELKAQITELCEKINNLQNDKEKLLKANQDMFYELKSLNAKLQDSKALIDKQDGLINELQMTISQQRDEITTNKELIDRLTMENFNYKHDINETMNELSFQKKTSRMMITMLTAFILALFIVLILIKVNGKKKALQDNATNTALVQQDNKTLFKSSASNTHEAVSNITIAVSKIDNNSTTQTTSNQAQLAQGQNQSTTRLKPFSIKSMGIHISLKPIRATDIKMKTTPLEAETAYLLTLKARRKVFSDDFRKSPQVRLISEKTYYTAKTLDTSFKNLGNSMQRIDNIIAIPNNIKPTAIIVGPLNEQNTTITIL